MRRFPTWRQLRTTGSFGRSPPTRRSPAASTCSTASSRISRLLRRTASSTRRSMTCFRSPRRKAQQPDLRERGREAAKRMHLGGVLPPADELRHRCLRVEPLDRAIEQARLVALVDHDPIGWAPPDLEGKAREGELACIEERASVGPRFAVEERDAAELATCELLQRVTVLQH